MTKPPIATICRLSILSGIALLLLACAPSSPIGPPKATNARLNPNPLARESVAASVGSAAAFTPATPVGKFILADSSDHFIEESEKETVDSLSCLACLAYIMLDGPPRARPGSLPGIAPKIVAVPLRC